MSRSHGHCRARRTPTYRAWAAAKNRCTNPSNAAYADYGGRGITMCERWLTSFENFLADMGERPEDATLDRWPDNNRGYEPENCRWSTRQDQAQNRRSNTMLTYRDETKPLTQWARDLGINQTTLSQRLGAYGWSIERALSTPTRVW